MPRNFQHDPSSIYYKKSTVSISQLFPIYLLFFYFSGLFCLDDFIIVSRNRNLCFGLQSCYVHHDHILSDFSEEFVKELLIETGIPSIIYLEYSKINNNGDSELKFETVVHEVFKEITKLTIKSSFQGIFEPDHILVRKQDMNYVTTTSSLR
ncbi:hypothetical protein DMUE_4351 [Dictyocoela muelleri]|nr:hypothetical protein DMUE_4351 [Dictyocoela muelleri]